MGDLRFSDDPVVTEEDTIPTTPTEVEGAGYDSNDPVVTEVDPVGAEQESVVTEADPAVREVEPVVAEVVDTNNPAVLGSLSHSHLNFAMRNRARVIRSLGSDSNRQPAKAPPAKMGPAFWD